MKKLYSILLDHKYFLAILVAGIFLRVWHIDWSLPEVFEEATPFRKAWAMWNWGKTGFDFNPHFFNYPALSIYLQWVVQSIQYGIGHLIGVYSNLTEFQKAYNDNPTSFILIARLVTMMFDIGTILVAYSLGSFIFNRRAGLLSAILVAINPLLIKQAQTITVDTPLVFLSLLSLYLFFRLNQTSSLRFYILAGVSLGCSMSTKYTGAFLFPVFVLAEVLRTERIQDGIRSLFSFKFLTGVGVSVLTFIVINPYIYLDYAAFQNDFSFEQQHMELGHLGVDSSSNGFVYYLLHVIPESYGWLLLVGILTSFIFLIVQRKKINWLLVSFPILYLIIISTWHMRVERYILPVIPILMVLISVGIIFVSEFISKVFEERKFLTSLSSPKRTGVIISGLIIIMLIVPVKETLVYHHSTTLPDTRTMAREWLIEHVAPKSIIVSGPFGIKIPKDMFQEFQIPFTPTGSENLFMFYQSEWFEDADILIASDYDYSRFEQDPVRYKGILPYYDSLRTGWTLLEEIKASNAEKGPVFWIYKHTTPSRDTLSAGLFDKLSVLAESSQSVHFSEGLARVYFMKGKLQKSEQLLRFALGYSPTTLSIFKEMIWVEFNQGKFQEARYYASRSLEIKPDQYEVLAIKGGAELRLGMFQEAEVTLNESIRVNPRFDMPYKDLFSMYETQHKVGKQIEVLQRYLSVVPPGSELAIALEEHIKQLEGAK